MKFLEVIKKARNYSRAEVARSNHAVRYTLPLTFIIYTMIFSIIRGNYNFYYFFLNSPKVIILLVIIITFFNIIFDYPEAINIWRNKEDWLEFFVVKWILAVKEAIIRIFIPSVLLLILFHIFAVETLEARFIERHPTISSPFVYTPTFLEGSLIILIIVLQLVMIFCAAYWSVSRFLSVQGYNHEQQAIFFDVKSFLIVFLIHFSLLIILFSIVIDSMFFEIKHEDMYNNWKVIYPFFKDRAYLILLIQASVLFLLNLFYFIDGKRMMIKREFVSSELRMHYFDMKEQF